MRATWILLPVALCLSCASTQLDGGPDSQVRLDTRDAIGWEPGGPFPLELTVYNASGHRLVLAQPRPEATQVKVFRASDGALVCKTPSPSRVTGEGWDAKGVRSSQGLQVTIDLWPYCQNLPQGVYRYELVYVANPAAASEVVFTGTLGPRRGEIAIGPGLSSDEAALAAALSRPSTEGPPPASSSSAAAAPSAQSVVACMDRELAARGLNAYGDPQGTTYPSGPPADEGGRVLYVAGRNPEIRAACHIQGF
jgi:hypothetical protein